MSADLTALVGNFRYWTRSGRPPGGAAPGRLQPAQAVRDGGRGGQPRWAPARPLANASCFSIV
jgi:hypothetical protein